MEFLKKTISETRAAHFTTVVVASVVCIATAAIVTEKIQYVI